MRIPLNDSLIEEIKSIPGAYFLWNSAALLALLPVVAHHHTAVGLAADGVGRDARLVLQGGMDHMALIGVHRLEGDVPAVLGDLAGDLLCKPLERFLALEAVVLRVDVDAHTLVLAAVDRVVRQMLNRVERFAAAADQNAEVLADEVDRVALVRRFHRVRHSIGAHVLEKSLDELLNALFRRTGLRRRVDLRLCRGSLLLGLLGLRLAVFFLPGLILSRLTRLFLPLRLFGRALFYLLLSLLFPSFL